METLPTAETAARRKAPAPIITRESKSMAAYRTITEVAADMGVATHVLRFWESKFPHIKPLKKSGGRRYYKADDIALLRLIQTLLYDQGMTIKGVQTYLKKSSKSQVAQAATSQALSPASILQTLKDIRNLLVEGLKE
ncbi:MAG: MerR family transcriptional regulator [Alphaproteobacteria bacterium]